MGRRQGADVRHAGILAVYTYNYGITYVITYMPLWAHTAAKEEIPFYYGFDGCSYKCCFRKGGVTKP